ncbi:hypothetical protein GCM10027566_22370 [Arachidicoccus ginsenosidivorans]|uniref:Phosphatase PAP2 family protein n=1 Tax=Arachidicoccus ginsenosidivorans TaxID=496057 RepID=A0A5B8VI15_9BACT|nr:hypothetical protein [Arachidicoccus ginsenosidivorans]QEC71184.1 hypothetical protein FSB73_05310 [Arachidicoccus ginsenosidivorans]
MAENVIQRQSAVIRILAKVLSYVFHPLFIPTYIFLWMVKRFPYEFIGLEGHELTLREIGVFMTTAFFPAFTVFLLWKLGFAKSMHLRNQKERIIPYIATMIFYWWMWYLSRNFTDQASALKFFYFGIFLATVPGLILNNFVKISMHAMGVGGALAGVILTYLLYQNNYGLDITVITLIAGIVCSARMALSEHSLFEINLGLVIGILCQFIGYWVMM